MKTIYADAYMTVETTHRSKTVHIAKPGYLPQGEDNEPNYEQHVVVIDLGEAVGQSAVGYGATKRAALKEAWGEAKKFRREVMAEIWDAKHQLRVAEARAARAKPRRFYLKPSGGDSNSFSVFERDRLNQFGEPYCLDAMVSYEEAVELVNYYNEDPTRAK